MEPHYVKLKLGPEKLESGLKILLLLSFLPIKEAFFYFQISEQVEPIEKRHLDSATIVFLF